MTLDQVGELYGITRERVRQLENRSLERMRIPALRDYLG
jgi:DNA-directed RNA polymerase sigma subunit (sigma70/sigma32)